MQINEHTHWGRIVPKGMVRTQRGSEHWAQGLDMYKDALLPQSYVVAGGGGVQLQSCLWLFCEPMDYSPSASLSMGFSRQEYWSGFAILFSRRSSWPRDQIRVFWIQFSSVQSLSHVRLFAIPWITACQASLSITNSQSLLKLMSIESVMPSSHLILCRPLLLSPPIPPSIRVFSNESTLLMRWPKYWSFGFNISPSKEHPGLTSFRMDWLDLLRVHGTLKNLL